MFLQEHYSWYINVYLYVRSTKCSERPTFYIAYDNSIDFFLHWDTDVYCFQKAFFLNKSPWINSSLQKQAIHQNYVILHRRERKAAFSYFFKSVFLGDVFSGLASCLSCMFVNQDFQKLMILQHSKCGVKKDLRLVCFFVDSIEKF